MTRNFDDRPAVREKTPILVGLIGPSGTGKTYSALRLAAGFQRISGGETYVIDTEARRSLHYAEKFKFRHLAFGAPFGPLDYLAALEHCVKKGATTIIVDSMSHEHEGPGGVLEMHDTELKRMGGQLSKSMLAWANPKADRRRLINAILQMNCNFIFSFRAKEKMKIVKGADPVPLGFQPIAGEEFVYELTLKCLLLPGANGVPTWSSDMPGEKMMMKLPEQFRALFGQVPQLTEDVGEALAAWASGAPTPTPLTADELVNRYEAAADPATHRALEDLRKLAWSGLTKDEKIRVKTSADEAGERIERSSRFVETDTTNTDTTDEPQEG
jgi:hypothetical protein